MSNFFQQTFLDNSVQQWFTTIGIIALAFVIKHTLSENVAKLILKLVKNAEHNIYRKKLLKNIVLPLENLIFWVVTLIAIDKLKYPQALDFIVYKNFSFPDLLLKLSTAWIIVCIFRLLIGINYFISYLIIQRSVEQKNRSATQAVSLLADLVKVVLIIIALFIILKAVFNYNTSSLVTGLGLVTAALALAAKESVENIICSFIIFFDKPFMVGDFVKVNKDISGNVEKIGLRSTRIRTSDKTLLSLPNKVVIGGSLENSSDQTRRRFVQTLLLSLQTPEEKIRTLVDAIRTIVSEKKDIISDSVSVYFTEAGNNAHKISMEYFTHMNLSLAEFKQLNENINLQILQKATELDIPFAGAETPIVLMQKQKEPDKTVVDKNQPL